MRRGQTVVDLVKDIGGHGVVGVERQHRSKEEGQGKGETGRHHMLDVGETWRLETPQPICHVAVSTVLDVGGDMDVMVTVSGS